MTLPLFTTPTHCIPYMPVEVENDTVVHTTQGDVEGILQNKRFVGFVGPRRWTVLQRVYHTTSAPRRCPQVGDVGG